MTEPAQLQAGQTGQPSPERPPIRVLLVDDHSLLLECIGALIQLETDMQVVGAMSSVLGLLDSVGNLQPDVILLDMRLGTVSGMAVIPLIRQISSRSRTVVLTAHAEPEQVTAALHAGASGYVLKSESTAVLMQTIRAAAQGRRYVSAGAESSYRTAAPKTGRSFDSSGPSPLTRRECEVLDCVVGGSSNKLTARKLGMSPKTVAKHRANLMRKLNLRNLSDLTTFACRHGIMGTSGKSTSVTAQLGRPR